VQLAVYCELQIVTAGSANGSNSISQDQVADRASVSLSLHSAITKLCTVAVARSSAHTSAYKALQTLSSDAVHVQAARANMSRSHNYNCICRSTAVLHTPHRQRQVTCAQRNRCRRSQRTHLYIYGTTGYHITTRLTRQQKPHCQHYSHCCCYCYCC
jgi:hypothetical protein